jgi:UDP-N-acetylmuramoyl-L-alanyl-D-glutamate--2,6-diaminopimelate ligase
MTGRTLQQLFSNIPDVALPAGAERILVRRVRDDSRTVSDGDLFVAVRGAAADGAEHVAEAVARGAAAVVVERNGSTVAEQSRAHANAVAGRAVPVIHVTNARMALAELAAASFGYPARSLGLVGITGTVGKTSVLAMLSEILAEAEIPAGTIGSLGIRFPGSSSMTPNTTPGAVAVQEALSRMVASGVEVAAMEVTSHALVQERVRGLLYDIGIFTNLTMLEHLEYHGSFRSYAAAKLRFLDLLAPEAPLCYSAGDRAVRQAARRHTGPRVSCGGGGAWVAVRRKGLSLTGTDITLYVRRPLPRLDGSCLEPCTFPLRLQTLGRPNTANATLAAAAGLIIGASPEAVQQALSRITPPKRRLEVIRERAPVIIDDTVGHPDSITGVFEVAERVPHRLLLVVFCIRGGRGEEINARDAEALAIWSRRVRIDRLLVTSAVDTADDRNEVSPQEEHSFLNVLRKKSVPHFHHRLLDDAVTATVQDAGDDDVVLLLGAQGMDAGASIVHRVLGARSG